MFRKELTLVELRIFDKLSTGRPYSTEELKACLTDELVEGSGALRFHIYNLRKKLQRVGMTIDATRPAGTRTTYYRQVRLLSANDE